MIDIVSFHSSEVPRTGKFIETNGRIEDTRGWEEWEMGSCYLLGAGFCLE